MKVKPMSDEPPCDPFDFLTFAELLDPLCEKDQQ